MTPLDHLHPATVHFPIALLLAASATGLLYIFWRPRADLRIVTWWGVIAGWLAAVAALFSGVFAQRNLPPDAPFRSVLNWHISAGVATLIVYGVVLYLRWLHQSERARQQREKSGRNYADILDDPQRRSVIVLLLIAGAVCVLLSGWNGGQLVYVWGVNVAQ